MIAHNRATKLWNIRLKVHEVLALLESDNIVKVNILISPFKVVDYPLIGKFLFDNEQILKKFNYSLIYVKVVEFGDHCLLVL